MLIVWLNMFSISQPLGAQNRKRKKKQQELAQSSLQRQRFS